LSSKNLFLATFAVFLVAGAALGASWAYYLAVPNVVSQAQCATAVTSETARPTQTQTPAQIVTSSTTSTPVATGVPKVTVDLTGLSSGPAAGDSGRLIIFLTVTNPSESDITVTSIKYEIWINDVYIGTSVTNQTESVKGRSELEIRTELVTVPLSTLPQDIVNVIVQEGYPGTLRIQGSLQIHDGFGTASVPFQGEGAIGTPIAT
jgi:LEA14-like dessication related protein